MNTCIWLWWYDLCFLTITIIVTSKAWHILKLGCDNHIIVLESYKIISYIISFIEAFCQLLIIKSFRVIINNVKWVWSHALISILSKVFLNIISYLMFNKDIIVIAVKITFMSCSMQENVVWYSLPMLKCKPIRLKKAWKSCHY